MIESFAYPLFIAFACMAAIQLFYYLFFYARLSFYKSPKKANSDTLAISVVICARNEYYNLEKFLPLILEQDYPDFEVVVVNDQSEDDSLHLLQQMKLKYPHLSIVDFQQELNFFKGKKFPLSVGIKSAKNDIVLLTDADCYPVSNKWISEYASQFDEQTEIVLGYGGYESANGLLNQIIRFDTFKVGMMYLSAALWRFTYMGVGRNMAYRKSLFYKHKGFSSHYKIASGDDDLFINEATTRKNTKVLLSKNSMILSLPKTKWSTWWTQKQRHLSTSRYYKLTHKLYLGFWEISTYFTLILFMLSIIFPYDIIYTLSIFGVLLLIRMASHFMIMQVLQEKKLLLFSLFTEPLLGILYPFISLSKLFTKQVRWK